MIPPLAMNAATAANADRPSTGVASRSTGSTGFARARSRRTSNRSEIRPIADATAPGHHSAPCVAHCSPPITSSRVNALQMPLTVSRFRSISLTGSGRLRPISKESSAIGAPAIKTQRQSKCSTTKPPSVGAIAPALATTTELMPIPLPRLRAG